MGMIMDKKSAIFYLYRKTLKNRIKKSLRKPVIYIYAVLVILYFSSVFRSFTKFFNEFENQESIFSAILTASVFIFIPSHIIAYSKRKGLVYKASDIYLLFSAPISPKRILLYAQIKKILIGILINLIICISGTLWQWLRIPVWKILIFFIYSCVLQNILEASVMILCYGNEKLSKNKLKIFTVFLYLLIGAFIAIGIAVYLNEGASTNAVLNYLHSPVIRLIPILGWNIAFIHLLFMDAAAINIIGSVLYFIFLILMFFMAKRMKCTGEYYEDAIKFSEDYEVARQRGKKGNVSVIVRKKKYGKATVTYKGGYAKAIFYRQLLEYKKNRFFIFRFYTVLCLAIGIGLAVFGYRSAFGEFAPFIILGVMAFLGFISSGYADKWGKELSKPYTYLIPDSSFKKMWYATLIEHIRALIDGCLLTLPAGIVLGLPIIQIVLIIAVYVCMQACKLYAEVMMEAILRDILGSVGKRFIRIFIEGLVISLGVIVAGIGIILFTAEIVLSILVVGTAVLTACMMLAASINFNRMETVD